MFRPEEVCQGAGTGQRQRQVLGTTVVSLRHFDKMFFCVCVALLTCMCVSGHEVTSGLSNTFKHNVIITPLTHYYIFTKRKTSFKRNLCLYARFHAFCQVIDILKNPTVNTQNKKQKQKNMLIPQQHTITSYLQAVDKSWSSRCVRCVMSIGRVHNIQTAHGK